MKISVIIPVYNSSEYLGICMKSVLNQTHKDLEIILVDDGSTDISPQLCDDYALQDPRVGVIHKKNGGSSTARNMGIEAASGDYIGFVDSDDFIELDMYENLLKCFEEHPDCKMAEMMYQDFDEEGNLVREGYKLSGETNFLPAKEDYRLLMLHLGDSSFCTKLFDARFMKKFRFPEGKLNEDFRLLLDMLMEVDGVYSLEKIGYNIILRGNSNSRGFKELFFNSLIENADYAYDFITGRYPDMEEEARRFYLWQRLDYMLHIPVERMKGNPVSKAVVKSLREHRDWIRKNTILTKKEKRNLLILSYIPKTSKRVHGVIMRFKRRK